MIEKAIFVINIAFDEDVAKVIKIVKQVGDEMSEDPMWRQLIVQSIEVPGWIRCRMAGCWSRPRCAPRPAARLM